MAEETSREWTEETENEKMGLDGKWTREPLKDIVERGTPPGKAVITYIARMSTGPGRVHGVFSRIVS